MCISYITNLIHKQKVNPLATLSHIPPFSLSHPQNPLCLSLSLSSSSFHSKTYAIYRQTTSITKRKASVNSFKKGTRKHPQLQKEARKYNFHRIDEAFFPKLKNVLFGLFPNLSDQSSDLSKSKKI